MSAAPVPPTPPHELLPPPLSHPARPSPESQPAAPPTWPGWGWLLPLLFGVAAWALYLPFVCPVLFVGDSGEFLTAAWSRGIAHPPGYPLYVLILGWWLQLPWQSPSDWQPALFGPAYGGNLFSTFAAALTVAGVARLLWQASRHPGWTLLGAILWMVTPTFFSQALITEVYTFFALIIVGYLLVLQALLEDCSPAALMGLGALQGALLATHPMGLLWLPVTAFAKLVYRFRKPQSPPGPWIGMAASCAAVLSVYLSLPMRSIQDPWLDWGNPDNWDRFWAVIQRVEYKGIILSFRDGGLGFSGIATAFANWTWAQYGWLLVPLGLGVILAWRRGGPWVTALSLAVLCWTLPFWWYFRHIPATELPFLEVYYIPTYLLLLLLGLTGYFAHPRAFRISMTGWQAGILALLVVGYAVRDWPATTAAYGRQQSQIGARFAVGALQSIPDQSILIVEGDEIFLFWYLQAVAGMKPDTVILENAILSDTTTWLWSDLRRRHPELAIPAVPNDRRFRDMFELAGDAPIPLELKQGWVARDLARTNGDRRVFLTGVRMQAKGGNYGLNWHGMLFELQRGEAERLSVDAFRQQGLTVPQELGWLLRQPTFDFYEQMLLEKYIATLTLYGQQALSRHAISEAERLFRFVLELDPESLELMRDLGKSLLLSQDWESAGEIFSELSRRDANDPLAPFALAIVHMHLGDLRAARLEAARARALDPDNRLVEREAALIDQMLAEEAAARLFREAAPPPETTEGSPQAPPSDQESADDQD